MRARRRGWWRKGCFLKSSIAVQTMVRPVAEGNPMDDPGKFLRHGYTQATQIYPVLSFMISAVNQAQFF